MAEGKTKPPQDIIAELGVDDLYEFLGVDYKSSNKEITSGYRKKALKHHPDKNPDNPSASELFQKLSKAYNILTDPAAKAAYDKWLRAKHAAKQRHNDLDAKRKKLKESLEMREKEGDRQSSDEAFAARQMEREINRLREEGFKKIKEEEEMLRKQLKEEKLRENQYASVKEDDTLPSLKITWKAKKRDPSNGGYTKEILEEILSKLGGVDHVLVSGKKNGSALASFLTAADAFRAMQSDCGLEGNPLQMTWASGKPASIITGGSKERRELHSWESVVQGQDGACVDESTREQREKDYESLTLMRMRQAQERKKLIEQLQKETD